MSTEIDDRGIHADAEIPRVRLEGLEVDGKNLDVRENAGATEIYDVDTGAVVMTLEGHSSRHENGGGDEISTLDGLSIGSQTAESHQSRHSSGGNDTITGIAASQLASGAIKIPVPIQIADSNQSGLASDTTGVKWTSNFVHQIDPQNLDSAVIRASWTASQTDSTTAIEVYDQSAATVLGSATGNTGTDSEGSVSGFTAGNPVVARANVTTASSTSGATTDLVYAVLELSYGVS